MKIRRLFVHHDAGAAEAAVDGDDLAGHVA